MISSDEEEQIYDMACSYLGGTDEVLLIVEYGGDGVNPEDAYKLVAEKLFERAKKKYKEFVHLATDKRNDACEIWTGQSRIVVTNNKEYLATMKYVDLAFYFGSNIRHPGDEPVECDNLPL